MKAVVLRELGGRFAFDDVPKPEPGAGQVLVDVRAAGVNFSDTLIVDGKYQSIPPLPFTPGKGIAGVVANVGSGVDRVAVGDDVVAFLEQGGFAEYAAAPATTVHPMSRNLDYTHAAALGHAAQTAYFALVDRLQIAAGESLLVTGASGVIGLATIEMAKAMGARVFAGVRSAEAATVVRRAGADDIVDLGAENLHDALREQILSLTDGKGVDCIAEMVGGDVFDAAVRALAFRGRLVILGFVAGRIPSLKMNYPLLKTISVSGMQWTTYRDREPEWVRRAQREIDGFVERGHLHGYVAATFPMQDAMKALDAVHAGGAYGKIVLVR